MPNPIARSNASYNARNTNNLLHNVNKILYNHEGGQPLSLNNQQRMFNMVYNLRHKRPQENIMHPGVLMMANALLRAHDRVWNNMQKRINTAAIPKKRTWPRNLEDPVSLLTLNNWVGNKAIQLKNNKQTIYIHPSAFNKWFGSNWKRMDPKSNDKISTKTHPLTRVPVLRRQVRLVHFIGPKPKAGVYSLNNLNAGARRSLSRTRSV